MPLDNYNAPFCHNKCLPRVTDEIMDNTADERNGGEKERKMKRKKKQQTE